MAKAKFERAKPHVNIGTVGHVPGRGPGLASAAAALMAAEAGAAAGRAVDAVILVKRASCGKSTDLVGLDLTREAPVSVATIREGAREAGGLLRRRGGVRSIDEEKRTVEVAFSSEEPVDRWFGTEVLDHSPGACDLSRLGDGGAVLLNHRWDQQVGVVESVRIDADRRGRAVLRFGRGAEADAVFRDVVDGIRRHVSVGYSVEAVRVEQEEGKPDLVTLTRWQPYEISIVAVPADPTVGVDRAAGPPEGPGREGGQSAPRDDARGVQPAPSKGTRGTGMEKTLRDAQGRLVRAKVDANDQILEVLDVIEEAPATRAAPQPAPALSAQQAREAGAALERARVTEIMKLARTYGQLEAGAEFAADATRSASDFQAHLLGALAGASGGQSRELSDKDNGDPRIGMSDADVSRYSFIRAIRAVVEPHNKRAQEAAKFELEASEAARERMGRDASGLVVPVDVLTRALSTSTAGVNPGETGGYLVDTTLMTSSFIEVLRNRSTFLRRATPMGGLIGNLAIPKKTATSSGYWIGEDQPAPEDNSEFGEITLAPKTCAALQEITRRALMQTSLDVEALVRADLAAGIALTIDLAGYYGTGAGQPLGISNIAGLSVEDFAVAGKPSWAEVVNMETVIGSANADVSGMAYVMPAGLRGHLKTAVKADGQGGFIWEQGNTVNGYATEVTNQVAAGEMFFGNFADALVGMWGGLELTADPYTHSDRGRLRLVAMQDVDIQFRRVESFVQGKAVV